MSPNTSVLVKNTKIVL